MTTNAKIKVSVKKTVTLTLTEDQVKDALAAWFNDHVGAGITVTADHVEFGAMWDGSRADAIIQFEEYDE